ncbi:hypothetical protein [Pedobacter sp. SYSU D00535]|uniref:hypothetical protein n=1 Tax=Pedobacter sp. SYSU D00535 TaxID=2810308 RepID=UPI001A971904|nr:hypothetical protein [Pedobacter sp. SYSU D00535]
MKKIFALLLPLMVLLASCQKNQYIIPNRTIIVDLGPNRWIASNGGRNYTAEIDMPEITDDFNERGGVLAYVSFGDRTYEQLPQVYNGVSYSYVTRPGQLVIELQSSDGTTVINRPGGEVTVKIVLVESEYE